MGRGNLLVSTNQTKIYRCLNILTGELVAVKSYKIQGEKI